MTNTDPEFYPLMGPFLSRRTIAGELGSPVWDDDGKDWHVAVEDGKAVGFVAHVKRGDGARFGSDYVIPELRRRGIYARLMAARMDATADAEIRQAVATVASLNTFLRFGFKQVGTRGSFALVEYWEETFGVGWSE